MAEKLKHPFVWLIVGMVIAGGAYWLWHRGQSYESTDNAYVNAHVVRIAAQVTGQVVALKVDENKTVKKDERLLQIDPSPFKIAVDRTTAQLQQARYQVQRTGA